MSFANVDRPKCSLVVEKWWNCQSEVRHYIEALSVDGKEVTLEMLIIVKSICIQVYCKIKCF